MAKSKDHLEPAAAVEEAATTGPEEPGVALDRFPYLLPLLKPAFWVIVLSLMAGLYVHFQVQPQWIEVKNSYQVFSNEQGRLSYTFKGREQPVLDVVPYSESPLRQAALDKLQGEPALKEQWVLEHIEEGGQVEQRHVLLTAKFHFGIWSLLPALAAVGLGALPGILAIAMRSVGFISKITAEAIENIDPKPVEAIRSVGARPMTLVK